MNLIRQVVNGWEKSTVFTWLFFFQSFNCHIIDVKVVAKNDKIKFHTHQTFHNIHDDNFTCKCVLFIWESWGQQLAENFMHKIHLPLGKNLPWTVNAAGNMHHLLVACYTGLSETGCWAGGGGAFVAPPGFGRSVSPVSTRRGHTVVWMAYRIYRQMLCFLFVPAFEYKI